MVFDDDNGLYVANVFGQTLSRIDPETGEILQQLGPSNLVLFPDDVTVGADGSLYWTYHAVGTVFRRLPGSWYNDVDVDANGAMYVSADRANAIYKLRSHGVCGRGVRAPGNDVVAASAQAARPALNRWQDRETVISAAAGRMRRALRRSPRRSGPWGVVARDRAVRAATVGRETARGDTEGWFLAALGVRDARGGRSRWG
jgi:hypothetical protein